jgi:hypothetical protein
MLLTSLPCRRFDSSAGADESNAHACVPVEGLGTCLQAALRIMRRDSAVGIAVGYGLNAQGVGVRVLVWSSISFSLNLPDRFLGLPSLQSNGYRELFPRR